ncbi:hypothetical protein [Burkholderia multivorans]|uniref:hypothetical protein n=1 Tax=Burkholderia multivorans TaxID=87883 RepID=UPI0021BE76D4|nr:hypothetical protein [Burkholderia multivorans]
MGWSIGYDDNWKRDIGYGVPATCDHPECNVRIDRGLAHVCAHQEPYGGPEGCGLYFCHDHLRGGMCERCALITEDGPYIAPFEAKPDRRDWIEWKLTDPSWQEWRNEHVDEVEKMRAAIGNAAEG